MTIPLPEPAKEFRSRWPGDPAGYTAEQMHAYAATAVAAERDKWRKVLAESCAEERSQMWEAGPGGGCSRAIEAEAAVAAERERCATIVETLRPCQRADCDDLAAAIRGSAA